MAADLILELSRDVRSCAGPLSAGYRGRLLAPQGRAIFDLHEELPFDGVGVPHDAILIVTIDADGQETRLPLLAWAKAHQIPLRCSRCSIDVLDSGARPSRSSTPERVSKCRRQRAETNRLAALLRAALDQRKARAR